MNESTCCAHTPVAVQPDTHINAPVNVHGWCFGLIPENGNWLDDVIDWQARQFRHAAVAQRIAACWNACSAIPTANLVLAFGTNAADVSTGCHACRHTFCRQNELCRVCGHVAEGQGWKGGPADPAAADRVADARKKIQAALAHSRASPAAPTVTTLAFHRAGSRCMSEYDCIEQGINFPAYERGISDAINACQAIASEAREAAAPQPLAASAVPAKSLDDLAESFAYLIKDNSDVRQNKAVNLAQVMATFAECHFAAAPTAAATMPAATDDEPSDREALIACLGDDAAKLRETNPDDEMAQTMGEAAAMLEADEVRMSLMSICTPAATVPDGQAVAMDITGKNPLGFRPPFCDRGRATQCCDHGCQADIELAKIRLAAPAQQPARIGAAK